MKKFVITLSRTVIYEETGTITIEANSKDEAREIFYDVPEYGDPYEDVVWAKSDGEPDYDNFEFESIKELK
jgi:hypothetical protein